MQQVSPEEEIYLAEIGTGTKFVELQHDFG